MSEFLKNLRSNQSVYSNGNRKNFDSYYHPNRERRSDHNRRSENRRKPHKDSGNTQNLVAELMPLIKEMAPKVVETFERIADSREKMLLAEERKTAALEEIMVSLTNLVAAQKEAPIRTVHVQEKLNDADTDSVITNRLDKESAHRTAEENRRNVIEIIQKMRNENYTYDHIAHYLTENQFPTFSHRGEWHAQTVHRLFKKGLDSD